MREVAARVAYPRLAGWILVGAVLFLISGVPFILAETVHEGFFVAALAIKYLGASLVVIGGFFYALYWSVDYGPEYVRDWRI